MRRVLALVAIIGLVGTIVGSSLVSELVKRRDLRESVKVDLELYAKLPDGDVKAELLTDIESRVRTITSKKQLDRFSAPSLGWSMLVAVSASAVAWTLILVNGSYRFERDQKGILRLVAADETKNAFEFVGWVALVVGVAVSSWLVAFAAMWLVHWLSMRQRDADGTARSESEQ